MVKKKPKIDLEKWKLARSKLSLREKVLCDVDDELYKIKKKIQKKYILSWDKARDLTNYSASVLMLSFPKESLKK